MSVASNVGRFVRSTPTRDLSLDVNTSHENRRCAAARERQRRGAIYELPEKGVHTKAVRVPGVVFMTRTIGVVALVSACSDASGPNNTTVDQAGSPFSVSKAHGSVTAFGSNGPAAAVLMPNVVYVALPTGSIPNAEAITIRARQAGTTLTIPAGSTVDGGLDPVPVRAGPGDTLDVEVRVTGSTNPVRFSMPVPGAGRPIVVRTSPSPRKRDVSLNANIFVVFSEPIDGATLNESSLQLTNGAARLPGVLSFTDSTHLTATFTPSAVLAGSTDYTLTVTQAIADVDGQALAAPVSVPFTTIAASAYVPVAAVDIGGLVGATIAVGAAMQVTARLRDATGSTLSGRTIVWASSKPSVATVTPSGLVTASVPGSAAITVTSEGKSATIGVSVTPPTSGVRQATVRRCIGNNCSFGRNETGVSRTQHGGMSRR